MYYAMVHGLFCAACCLAMLSVTCYLTMISVACCHAMLSCMICAVNSGTCYLPRCLLRALCNVALHAMYRALCNVLCVVLGAGRFML